MVVGRAEQFNFDGIEPDTVSLNRTKKGIYISPVGVGIYILLTICIAIAVGLIVKFANPRTVCESGSHSYALSTASAFNGIFTSSPTTQATSTMSISDDDQLWSFCLNVSRSRNECLPGALPCTFDVPDEDIDYLLPTTFRPLHYILDIKPDIYTGNPSTFSYQGSVNIVLECTQTSDVIFVHFRKMTIDENVHVTSNDAFIGVIKTDMAFATEFFKIYLDRKVQTGEHVTVLLNYSGILQLDMIGMYYSDYTYHNETKYVLATQFEATDARKAFPCLDEPSMKATFEVTLWRKEPMIALTNMPLVHSTDRGDGWISDYFGTTPVVMSTYLVAFAVADYNYIEKNTTGGLTQKTLRHYARPDYIALGYVNYSLDVCIKMFDFFETYFDFPFEMPKEDQISIPDFDSGAMENWGLIMYREGRMVNDPGHVTLYELQRMTGTLSHELLHQWLGNVVTCRWWSDLWLNEGMARYHQHMAMRDAHPDWDVDQLFAAQVTYRAFASDQLGHSHPIHNPVYTPHEIDGMFNSITYDKAGCVIRMMHELVLGDSYKPAMRNYVKQYAYDSVSFIDLLGIWDQQAVEDNIQLEKNITMLMMPWLTQMGCPVVKMERVDAVTVRLTQKLFLQNPQRPLYETYPPPYNYAWDIPVSYVTSKNMTSMKIEWLYRTNRSITLSESLSYDDWILGNYMQYGIYRINYDISNWNSLIKQLKSDHKVFDVVNRGQLIQDSFNLGRSGDLEHVVSLKVTEYLKNETDYLPWYAAADQAFVFFSKMFRNSADYLIFKTYVRNLLQRNYDSLGWVAMQSDTHHDIYLRDLTLTHACRHDNIHCIQTAKEYFARWKHDPTNHTIIVPDIRDAVYCTAIRYGLATDWDFMFQQYKNFQHFSNEKYRRRKALSCTRDRATLTKLFQMGMIGDQEIMSHDPNALTRIMRDVSKNPIGHYVAWDALNMHWDILQTRFTILAAVCDTFSTEYDLEKYDAFVTNHPATSQNEMDNYEDMRDIIKHNIRWRSANEDAVFSWLRDVTHIN